MVDKTRVKVLVVIDSLGQGGAEQSLMATLPLMPAHGVDPRVALIHSRDPGREQQLRDAGVPVRTLNAGTSLSRLTRQIRAELLGGPPYGVMHVNLFQPIVAGGIAAVGTGVPVIASMVSTPITGPRESAGSSRRLAAARALERWACRNLITHLHSVSDGVKEATASGFGIDPARITTVGRGRDRERFRIPQPAERCDARASFGYGESDHVLGVLARHDPAKALDDTLVGAVQLLVREHPNIRVLIAGREGPSTPSLAAAIAELGLEAHIRLLGDVGDPVRVLAASDVFVLSSRREGTSGATIEAMAMGLPIAATVPIGMRGMLTDGVDALTCEVDDVPGLAAAIARLLSDPRSGRELGNNARRHFERVYTNAAAAAGMAALYRRVAETGRGRRDRA